MPVSRYRLHGDLIGRRPRDELLGLRILNSLRYSART